jgi:NAD(P)-dependent dehydrogenase (short-subunit alcohol dehydrogenase family)
LYKVPVVSAHLDVTDSASIARVAKMASERLGGIEIWVNNAGIFPAHPILEMSDEVWNQVMAVNLRGVFACSREAARRMTAKGGVIVNVISTAGFKGVGVGLSAYVASKHGARGLTKQLALELAPQGIRVLGVAPTYCVTEGTTAHTVTTPNVHAQEITAQLPCRLGRVGVPDDVARVALFCASDMSIFMTGSTLLVDAGETI